MTKPHRLLAALVVSLGLIATGCASQDKTEVTKESPAKAAPAKDSASAAPHADHLAAAPIDVAKYKDLKKAVAQIKPTKGNKAEGTVTVMQEGDKVHVMAHITNLAPNSKHGFHVHEGIECGEDGMAAKGHYNPEKHDHGLPAAEAGKRHAGDWGNLEADDKGVAEYHATFDNITLAGDKNPVLGRAVMVHEKEDTGKQPTGDAGGRIACGILMPAEEKAK